MAFTLITITADEIAPNGQPASGTVTALLSQRMQNGTATIDPQPVNGMLVEGALMNDSGEQAFQIAANNDTATTPASPPASYQFVVMVDGAPIREFSAIVPYNAVGATIDLATLQDQAT